MVMRLEENRRAVRVLVIYQQLMYRFAPGRAVSCKLTRSIATKLTYHCVVGTAATRTIDVVSEQEHILLPVRTGSRISFQHVL